MTGYTTLRLEIADGVARVELATPDTGNAMTPVFFKEFGEAVGELAERRDEVRAVLLCATGRFFSVGASLDAFAAEWDRAPGVVLDGTYWMHPALARLARLDAPVVAAVQGTATGGALALVAHADLVIGARGARYGAAYSRLGFSPDLGATVAFAQRMGVARARRFLLLGEMLDGEQALATGIVDELVDDADVAAVAEERARTLAAGPTRAYGEIRRLIARALAVPLETQLEDEAQGLTRSVATHDGGEGVRAFLEKRPPEFLGR